MIPYDETAQNAFALYFNQVLENKIRRDYLWTF